MMTKVFGLILLGMSLACVYLFESSTWATGAFRIFHWPAIVLTGIGPVGLVLLCSDWHRMKLAGHFLKTASPARSQTLHLQESKILFQLSHDYYAQGPKALESASQFPSTPFFARTMERLSVRMPTADVRYLLEREKEQMESQLAQVIPFFSLGVRLAPSVGMLGTILGMVQLLAHLQDPSHIGSNMSLALLTTFYGLFFSLVIWTPLQQRMERFYDVELQGYDQLLHWLDLLEKRKPAQYFSEIVQSPNGHLPVKIEPQPAN